MTEFYEVRLGPCPVRLWGTGAMGLLRELLLLFSEVARKHGL